jgi:tetratricopeptide (TPR) repeat protein
MAQSCCARIQSAIRAGRSQTAILRIAAATLFFATTALAQSVRWDPPGGQLGFNQVSELALVFEDCEPEVDQLKLPQVDGLTFGQPSTSSETSMINFKVTRRYSLVFPVRPTKRAGINIPAFDVPTDKGTLRVKPATYSVGDATVGGTGLALSDVASANLDTPRNAVWAGEVFPVTFSLSVVKRYFHSLASAIDWQPAPAVVEEWSKPEPSEALERGERRIVATQNTRGYIKQPGNYTLKPAAQNANLIVGTTGFGLFSTPAVEQRTLTTAPLTVSVKPLPAPPPGFSGAVGQFALTSKVVPTSPVVGEPVTWTLELSGTGNWPDIPGLPSREVSNDFQVVQPKSKRTMKNNSLFTGTLSEDVVLVPTKPGHYALGPVRFTYFDPAVGAYKTITTDSVTLDIAAASAPQPAPSTPGAPVQFSLNLPSNGQPAAPAPQPAVPPVPPENLPRDPLPDTRTGIPPFTTPTLVVLCLLSSVLGPLIVWLALALQRSRANDPQRRRREALRQLATVLHDLSHASAPDRLASALRLWQQHTATLWEISHAAPGAPLVHARVSTFSRDAAAVWTALWNDADRTLHGKDVALPQDWRSRAEGALRAVRVAGWPPFSALAPRNLLPFLFVLALLFGPVGLRADGAADAYKRGEFAAAEAAWRSLADSTPSDWAARHNLGLALAQQDRWAEATAYWTGAFLLAPRAGATRWDLSLGLQRSGLAPSELVELARGHGRFGLARLASPGEWQLALVGAALLIALALVLLLLKGYRRIGNWAQPTALTIMLVAILSATVATLGLRTYGQLARPDAVFVWRPALLRSIPTEADTSQKTSPLSAGSLAVTDRTFPTGTWMHLVFPGGQSGWVRTEDLIRLYR